MWAPFIRGPHFLLRKHVRKNNLKNMYHNKKLNITNFDTITGLVIHSRWEAEYQGFNEKTYRFNFMDNNVPWNYSFIEMELEKKIVGSSCALNITDDMGEC